MSESHVNDSNAVHDGGNTASTEEQPGQTTTPVDETPTDETDSSISSVWAPEPSPGPSRSDLLARLAYVQSRIDDMRETARSCGCDSAIGQDEDNSVLHLQLECSWLKYLEYREERRDLRRLIREAGL